jgi:hypothetical protein
MNRSKNIMTHQSYHIEGMKNVYQCISYTPSDSRWFIIAISNSCGIIMIVIIIITYVRSVSSQTKDYQHNSLSSDMLIGWLDIYTIRDCSKQHKMIVVSIINILYQ